jgi:hypothetical protein
MFAFLRTKLSNVRSLLKAKALQLWLRVPFGEVCTFRNGNLSVTVTKQFMVIISDGQSQDALPLPYVSQDLAYRIFVVMKDKGYDVDLSDIPSEVLAQLRDPNIAVRVTA